MADFRYVLEYALNLLQMPFHIWGFTIIPLHMFIAFGFISIAITVIKKIFE